MIVKKGNSRIEHEKRKEIYMVNTSCDRYSISTDKPMLGIALMKGGEIYGMIFGR